MIKQSDYEQEVKAVACMLGRARAAKLAALICRAQSMEHRLANTPHQWQLAPDRRCPECERERQKGDES